jgi:hypothetical protein
MKIQLSSHYIWSNPDNYIISRNNAKALGYYPSLNSLYLQSIKIKDNIELLKELAEQENRVKLFFENNHILEYKNTDIDGNYYINVINNTLILYKRRGENKDKRKVVTYPSKPQGALYNHFHYITRMKGISNVEEYQKHIDKMVEIYKEFYKKYNIMM